MVEGKVLQQCIPLAYDLLVVDELLEVGAILLRDDTVYKPTAGFAAFGYKVGIVRRNNYQRYEADMFAKFVVGLAVALQYFLLAPFKAAYNIFCTAIFIKSAINYKKLFAVPYVLYCHGVEIAASVGKVVHGIQYIGLSNPVWPGKAIDAGVKLKIGFLDIFVV